uniref:sulfurtransferase TusA family protein n=1 Tax=Thaumasiovibrio occultus TaxID=1891184 RepID=UPI000B35251B|nr:sulfurtransferase TusA family protein [Thaumasiovibrio occultus]
MTPQTLDLRNERCPMALLKVKRWYAVQSFAASLEIYLSDSASVQDIEKYLHRLKYTTATQTLNSGLLIKLKAVRE